MILRLDATAKLIAFGTVLVALTAGLDVIEAHEELVEAVEEELRPSPPS